MILSILICHLKNRRGDLLSLLKTLYGQIHDMQLHADVEILIGSEGKEITTGEKRNKLLNRSAGKYIIFIDDDDEVTSDYLPELMKACESDADCFGMKGWMTYDGGRRTSWVISKDYENHDDHTGGEVIYRRKTNHITGVKREIALQAGFPDKSNAEDKYYSDCVAPLCQTEYKIEKEIYHYKYSSANKEY